MIELKSREDEKYLNRVRALEKSLERAQVTGWIRITRALEVWEKTEPHVRYNVADFPEVMRIFKLETRPETYLSLKALLKNFGEDRLQQAGTKTVTVLKIISASDTRWKSVVTEVISRSGAFQASKGRQPSPTLVRAWIKQLAPDLINTPSKKRNAREKELAKRVQELETENAELKAINAQLYTECLQLRKALRLRKTAKARSPQPFTS